jgi:cyanophycinase
MKRIALFLMMMACALPLAAAKKSYTYYRLGSMTDGSPKTVPGTVLMGGGTDVDAAFQWLCEQGGQGDFLVIRATGTDAYNPYVQQLCPNANSVATLIVPSREAAADPFVVSAIAHAEAIWIAGGDQSNYVNYWKGTELQKALNARIAEGMPVGGTSAGMNVLTQFVYSALASQGVTSSQALADPYNRYMTFDRNFAVIPSLVGLIGDPHFATRDRMGRDLAFLCRIAANGWSDTPKAVAVDEATALLIDDHGQASLVGAGRAYFLQAPGKPEVCQSKTPLTYLNIAVYRIAAGGHFNLTTWSGTGGGDYAVSANAGVLSSTPPGDPY